MPLLLRYFLYVGGVLLALLFTVESNLPRLPVAEKAEAHLPSIRIYSDENGRRELFSTPAFERSLLHSPRARNSTSMRRLWSLGSRPRRGRRLRSCSHPIRTICNQTSRKSSKRSRSANARLQRSGRRRPRFWWRGNLHLVGMAADTGGEEQMRRSFHQTHHECVAPSRPPP